MKQYFLIFVLSSLTSISTINCQDKSLKTDTTNKSSSVCSDECQANNKTTMLSCKLSSPELQERKKTVLASLKNQLIEKKELQNGFAFKFSGSDKMVDELTEFIKTERECCEFFTFNLSIGGDKREAWLELTGDEGVKEFIGSELGL